MTHYKISQTTLQAPSGSSSLVHKTTSSHLPAVSYSSEDTKHEFVGLLGSSPVLPLSHDNDHISSLNPEAPLFIPSNTQTGRKKSNKKKPVKQQSPTSQLDFDLEFKLVELNSAKAMIVELEMENKKLKQSKTILESRIKLFEEERQRQAKDHLSQNPQLPSTLLPVTILSNIRDHHCINVIAFSVGNNLPRCRLMKNLLVQLSILTSKWML